ncbi:hypothetical protein GLAREA_03582 [Glarea lozoyensis ATCC 20868]|uniref:Uncharacterized protein n=1 Tax=Glarea lozoyensis (strain ATCC 20868 / MF5171) TaxID=1116229 RepID=S3CYC5_GLAL2|nr:uncharacterized protein GLAREA_03582 [Glarea lozoyensis ATCC 20868]EPE30615.1 hypothetical protein GLAREA_03582 [Glarea lozoyensis ATCC 20868]
MFRQIVDSFLGSASTLHQQTKQLASLCSHQNRWRKNISILNISSFMGTIIASFICIKAINYQPTERQCDDNSYVWSPASDHISYSWSTEYVDLGTYTPYFDVVYKQVVEDEWNKIIPKHPISIPSSRLAELNQSTPADSPLWIRDPNNRDSVLALPQVFVDLGCLNFLRQWSSKFDHDYSYLKVFQDGDKTVNDRAHQCLERLRHSISCWGDTTVILEFIDEPYTKVDFGTLHYCRDFDRIGQWIKENGVKEVELDNLWWGGAA